MSELKFLEATKLKEICEKWKYINISPEIANQCVKAIEPLENYIHKLLCIGMDIEEIKQYSKEVVNLLSSTSMNSFMVGLEYASTNGQRTVLELLEIVGNPAANFMSRMVNIYIERGIINKDDVKTIKDELGHKALIQSLNECFKIGIEFFKNTPPSMFETIKKMDVLKINETIDAMVEEAKKQIRQNQQRNLLMFEAKWKNVRLPRGIEKQSFKITGSLLNSINDMWQKAGLRMGKNEWGSLGEQMVAIIGPPMVRCYYLGYEMASGNVERREGNSYLLTAIDPIETFVIGVTGTLMESGKVSEEVGKKLVDTIVAQAITAGNEHIILGINNYHIVGR